MLLRYISWTVHTMHIRAFYMARYGTVMPKLQMLTAAYLQPSAITAGWACLTVETLG